MHSNSRVVVNVQTIKAFELNMKMLMHMKIIPICNIKFGNKTENLFG